MPSINLILEFWLRILTEENRTHYLVVSTLACLHLKTKTCEVGPQHSQDFVTCQALFFMRSPYLRSMSNKQVNQT